MAEDQDLERLKRFALKQMSADEIAAAPPFGTLEQGREVLKALGVDEKALQRSLGASNLEPEITDDMLHRFVTGRSDEVEREIIESMIVLNPGLGEGIAAIREDLADPGWIRPLSTEGSRGDPNRISGNRISIVGRILSNARMRLLVEGAALTAVAAGLAIFFVYGSRMQDVATRQRQGVVTTLDGEKDRLRGRVAALLKDRGSLESQIKLNAETVANLKRTVAAKDLALSAIKKGGKQKPSEIRRIPSATIADGSARYVKVANRWARVMPKADPLAKALDGDVAIDQSLSNLSAEAEPSRGPVSITIDRPDFTAVLTTTPILSWSESGRHPDAAYRVAVYAAGRTIFTGPGTRGPRFKIPTGILSAGHQYGWEVRDGERKSRRGVFRVLSAADSARAEAILRNSGKGHLDKGIGLAKLGLLDDATSEFQALRASGHSTVDRLLTGLADQRSKLRK